MLIDGFFDFARTTMTRQKSSKSIDDERCLVIVEEERREDDELIEADTSMLNFKTNKSATSIVARSIG